MFLPVRLIGCRHFRDGGISTNFATHPSTVLIHIHPMLESAPGKVDFRSGGADHDYLETLSN